MRNFFSPRYFLAVAADPGKGPRGPRPPLFLDQTEAQGAEKKRFFETGPRPLSDKGQDLDDRPPPHPLI